jgi:hypothetical protein
MTRYVAHVGFAQDSMIGDAMLFRPEGTLPNKSIHRLWEGADRIVFVHNNYKYYRDFCDSVPARCSFVHINSANSAVEIDKTTAQIFDALDGAASGSARVLISGGIAAKLLVNRVSRRGYRAFDMGHYFDYRFYNLVQDWKVKRG